jgi:hypothetical protein
MSELKLLDFLSGKCLAGGKTGVPFLSEFNGGSRVGSELRRDVADFECAHFLDGIKCFGFVGLNEITRDIMLQKVCIQNRRVVSFQRTLHLRWLSGLRVVTI